MKRFFKWLFGAFKPDSSKYVKNMKSSDSVNAQKEGFGKAKKKRSATPVLAWVLTADIKDNKEDSHGVSIAITLKNEVHFKPIDEVTNLTVDSKKKGLSLVEHNLSFSTNAEFTQSILNDAKLGKLSFLYRNTDGDLLFLGEKNGLALVEGEDSLLRFKGEESDVFFKVTEECFYELLPNIEK